VFAGNLDRSLGRAAEVHRQVRHLDRLHIREGALKAVVPPGIVKGRLAGPGRFHHIEIFARAGVALVLGQEVAILPELMIIAAGDDVNAGAAVGEVIESGELAGGHCRCGKARAMRDHQVDALGDRGSISRDVLAFRGCRVECDKEAIKASVFLRLGQGANVVAVDDRSLGGMDLRLVLRADKANELNVLAHGGLLFLRSGECVS
jgi:hypothetical protein